MIEMSERRKVKITVLRRFKPSEVFETSPATPVTPLQACELYQDGQQFIISEDLKMPEGFCTSAWSSIYGSIRTLSFGGNFPWFKENGIAINCCIDGLRPVVFKLERM